VPDPLPLPDVEPDPLVTAAALPLPDEEPLPVSSPARRWSWSSTVFASVTSVSASPTSVVT
jgi:hypothetical protein